MYPTGVAPIVADGEALQETAIYDDNGQRGGGPLSVWAVVLAAGTGKRYGGAKLVAPWRERPLLAHPLATLAVARAAMLIAGIVLVRHDDDEAVGVLGNEFRCFVTDVPASDEGLAWSVRAGLRALEAPNRVPRPEAALICLGDQPLIRSDVIRALIEAGRRGVAPVVRPVYREEPDRPGHPLYVSRKLWHLAGELSGDRGFWPVLERHGISMHPVSVAGSNPDVDTPDDIAALDRAADGSLISR